MHSELRTFNNRAGVGAGLPITVSEILAHVADGLTPEQVIALHPALTVEDYMACVLFLANRLPES